MVTTWTNRKNSHLIWMVDDMPEMTSIILVGLVFHWGQCLSVERSPSISSSWMLAEVKWASGLRCHYTTPEVFHATRERWCHQWRHTWYFFWYKIGSAIFEVSFSLQQFDFNGHDFRGRVLLIHGSCWTCHEIPGIQWWSVHFKKSLDKAPRRPVGSFSVENHPSEKPATCVLTTWRVGRGRLETEYRASPKHDPNIGRWVEDSVSWIIFWGGFLPR